MVADDAGRDYESSPDPLNASINGSMPRARRTSTRTPLASSSPSKQNRATNIFDQIENMNLSSPTKSMIMKTGKAGGASPWRIKVTVQAEPQSGGLSESENTQSPSVRQRTRTTTTTIPLKDADASSPVKRGRGRPRKSDTPNATKSKRSGTPVRRRRKSSVGASELSAADVSILSTDAAPKKRRGRPPKKRNSAVAEEDTMLGEHAESNACATTEAEPEAEAEAEVAAEVEAIGEVENTQINPQTPLLSQENMAETNAAPIPTPAASRELSFSVPSPASVSKPPASDPTASSSQTPPQEYTMKPTRARKATPHAKKIVLQPYSSEAEDDDINTPSETDDGCVETHIKEHSQGSLNIAIDRDEDEAEELYEITACDFDEGVTRLPDDTTIIDSEHFSMISVDSLPSSGGFTSPAEQYPKIPSKTTKAPLDKTYLGIPSDFRQAGRKNARDSTKSSPTPMYAVSGTESSKSSPPVSRNRHVTPVMTTRQPSNPPALIPACVSPTEVATPRIGHVVKAGVALQGVLDPDRLTPIARTSSEESDGGSEQLDSLFRGFSAGTRKELQAGLRLGEQLAKEEEANHIASPVVSSPIKSRQEPAEEVSSSTGLTGRFQRLSQEAPDHMHSSPKASAASTSRVQYPSLRVIETGVQLVSPARSDDEMSWRVDTPPVTIQQAGTTANHDRVEDQGRQDMSDIWQEEATRTSEIAAGADLPKVTIDDTPQMQDIFADDGPAKPARGKLPNTWRRKSSNHFNYSDEAEESESNTREPAEDDLEPPKQDKGKGRLMTPPTDEDDEQPDLDYLHDDEAQVPALSFLDEHQIEYEDDLSEGSDDTGMFFQANLPNVFTKKRSRELRKQRSQKLDLSLLIDEGHSLVPDSSPKETGDTSRATRNTDHAIKSSPKGNKRASFIANSPIATPSQMSQHIASSPPAPSAKQQHQPMDHATLLDDGQCLNPILAQASPVHSKPHPFKNTPPRFAVTQFSSPAKSSPLRQSLQLSDYEDGSSHAVDESSLPVAPSSPFHTIVDQSFGTLASDQAQFQQEMEGNTDSSIRRVRNEADAHAEAYETQYRSLNEIEEVTEPSRTFRTMTVQSSSSILENSILRPQRVYTPLFHEETTPVEPVRVRKPATKSPPIQEQERVMVGPQQASTPPTRPTGFLTRLTSTLFSALQSPSPPPLHPAIADFNRLPSIEPWTRTHYKALDKLYQLHKKQATLFAPSANHATSNTNNAILDAFLSKSSSSPTNSDHLEPNKRFLGAQYSIWGYGVQMTEPLLVIAAVFMQLMTLRHINEYELEYGKAIDMGNCGPGPDGELIDEEAVMERLGSVIMGEALRRDEKKGREVKREGRLQIVWGDGTQSLATQ